MDTGFIRYFKFFWVSAGLLIAPDVLALELAFFSSPHSLEKDGRFYHVALSYRGHWLHAHPTRGVELTKNLSWSDGPAEIWTNPQIPEPSLRWVKQQLSKRYDPGFSWNSSATTYCAKLVAQFLRISPLPMHFEGSVWNQPTLPNWVRAPLRKGHPGLSPDDLYAWLQSPAQQGWSRRSCAGNLSWQKKE